MKQDVSADIALGIYEHYKGSRYEVLALCTHSETEEAMVFYRCLYGDYSLWVRPAAMFVEEVEVDGRKQARFILIEAAENKEGLL
ncbi:DUF1653 domain-containing protein [Agaribacterium sp. ZY112]|uniref:DUF1653 domain-containing protein n=1 Tax=Agaribacterium sp. ZY112 TaxID=3233574 RepID=UPI0035260C14